MPTPRVTAAMLRKWGACSEQVAIVEREWPNGAPITVPTIRKAYRLGLDVEWLAHRVLSTDALAECERVTASAWAEYERVMAPALAEYNRARAEALAPLLRAAIAKATEGS